jgi:M6 family metalloprotease-like protein
MGYDQGSSFQTWRDVPPSFRRGSNGQTNMYSFDSVAIPWARDRSREATGVTLFESLDFFFLLHAGYDESGVWQQFGMFQFPSRKDIPYELGPGPRMLQVEQFFTENPDYLTTYASRYSGSNASAANAAFWAGERDKYAALKAEGKEAEYVFKLQQTDWDWVNGYNDQTQRNTRYVNYTCWEAAVGEWSHMTTASASNTGVSGNRSIRYSTQGESDGRGTFAHEFGHIGNLPDNYQLQWTISNSPLTEPWEVMSGGQIAGPFGEHTRWQVPGGYQGDSVPTIMTMRNKITLNYYDTLTASLNNTIRTTSGAKANDLLMLTVQNLAGSTPVVAEVVSRNIPLNNQGLYPQLDQYGLVSPNYYKGIHLSFVNNTTSPYRDTATRIQSGWTWTYTARAIGMGIEVVDQSGYDSFAPDHGVLLSRIANESTGTGQSYTWNVIDSHLYDIALVDYMTEGLNGTEDDYVAYALGSRAQLFDGAFHAGKSFTDTGYYSSIYDPADPRYNEATPRKLNTSTYDLEWKKAMLKPGSIQRWEPQNGRPITSGDSINEWHDTANNLHFYILAKNYHDGRVIDGETQQFLSYTIGVRHGNGTAVPGALTIEKVGAFEPAFEGRYAKQTFKVTQTGATATDILKVTSSGALEGLILDNLYALENGEIVFDVYIKAPIGGLTAFPSQYFTVKVASESNPDKFAESK